MGDSGWRSKLVSSEEAMRRVRSGDHIFVGSGCAEPQALAADMDSDEPRRSHRGLILAILGFLVLAGIGSGTFFARDLVMRFVPMTKEIYSMLGLAGEPVGAGLDIRSVASERASEGGIEVLLVRGVIANVSAVERPVPDLRVVLFDGNNRPTQSVIAEPAKKTLPPGGEIGFRVPLRDPSPLARRLEVTFAEPAKAPNQPDDGAAKPPAKEGAKEPAQNPAPAAAPSPPKDDAPKTGG